LPHRDNFWIVCHRSIGSYYAKAAFDQIEVLAHGLNVLLYTLKTPYWWLCCGRRGRLLAGGLQQCSDVLQLLSRILQDVSHTWKQAIYGLGGRG
jgi:hypothetical protein